MNYYLNPFSISVSRHQYRSNWSSYTPSHLDSTLVSNMHKLFSERIEIFSAVEFSKVSILTGVIKISLKVKTYNLNIFLYLYLHFINCRLLWNVLDWKLSVNMDYNKFKWILTTYNFICGDLCLMKSKHVFYFCVLLIKYFFSLVHFLLDEILGSAVHRCLEPVLMEPSVVDIICERGWMLKMLVYHIYYYLTFCFKLK